MRELKLVLTGGRDFLHLAFQTPCSRILCCTILRGKTPPSLAGDVEKLKWLDAKPVRTSKFSMTSFYLTSFICQVHARVYMQQILYDKFSYDKFYLLV